MWKVVVVAVVCGCSFIGASAPPQQPHQGRVRCSDSYALPVVDAVVAGAVLAAVASAVSAPQQSGDTGLPSAAAIGATAAVVIALPFGASAMYGFSRIDPDACKAAEAAQGEADDERLAQAMAEQRRTHAEAMDLTSSAVAAADAGDCSRMHAIAERIRKLDAEVYDRVVAGKPGVVACAERERQQARAQQEHERARWLLEHTACLEQRHAVFDEARATENSEARKAVLAKLPDCGEPPQ